MPDHSSLLVVNLGLAPYGETLELMRKLAQGQTGKARSPGAFPLRAQARVHHGPEGPKKATFWPPRRACWSKRDFEVHNIERGGLITYHGPGPAGGLSRFCT